MQTFRDLLLALWGLGATLVTFLFGSLTAREWIPLIAMVLTASLFMWKLKTDAAAARYRETLTFLDKNTASLLKDWSIVEGAQNNGEAIEALVPDVIKMLGILDTAALLIQKKAFDEELIYNFWWKYVVAPMEAPAVASWVQKLRQQDKAVLEHYCQLQNKWKKRVEKERAQGLANTRKAAQSGVTAPTPIPNQAPSAGEAHDATSSSERPFALVATPATAAAAESTSPAEPSQSDRK